MAMLSSIYTISTGRRRRGLAQAPVEREAESQPVSVRVELVLTGFSRRR